MVFFQISIHLKKYNTQYKKVSNQRIVRRKKKWIETKRGKINKVNAIQPQMDVQNTLFQSTVSFDNNSVNEKLQVFIFVYLGFFCMAISAEISLFFLVMKVCQAPDDLSKQKEQDESQTSCQLLFQQETRKPIFLTFCQGSGIIHTISCYPQTFSESKYLRLSVATYFALIYNFHVTFFIRKLQTLQNIKVQACRFCILPVLS